MKAKAFASDAIVFLCWALEEKIVDCLGFAITRIDVATGERKELRTYVPFEGTENAEWKSRPSSEWPIQKCDWMDFTVKTDTTYKYEIVPMVGKPGELKAHASISVTTDPVTPSTKCGEAFECAFTNGFLSTQALRGRVALDADGVPDFNALVKAIGTPGDPLREHLAGNALSLLKWPLINAKTKGGRVMMALYELCDPELVQLMADNPELFSLILSNTGEHDETNKEARERLHKLKVDITDRMLPGRAIGHNKVQVYVGPDDKPQSVTTTSINATQTGLCCQSNNIMRIHSPELAELYVEYIKLLKEDKAEQGKKLREANAARKKDVVLADGTRITVWFSPNTKEAVKSPRNPAVPPDIQEVYNLMDAAKQGIFYLAFYPGKPSIISKIAEMSHARPELILRGAVSSYEAIRGLDFARRAGEPPVVVTAAGIEKKFASWRKELLKLPDAHAIIHDKLVLIDPFSDECVLILGSHNLGFKASYSNDENMIIIRGNRAVVMRYLVHILDVYNHYRFRSAVNSGRSKFKGTLAGNDAWQNRFLSGPAHREMVYFATGVLPELIKSDPK